MARRGSGPLMGLLLPAVVRCNCFAEGRCTPPPFDPALVVVSDDQWDLALKGEDYGALVGEFDDWAEACCDHEGMRYEAAVIHGPMRGLQLALPFIGDGRWPGFDAVFPFRWNEMASGAPSTYATPEMLADLERFDAACAESNAWSLVDTKSDLRISSHAYPDRIQRVTLWGNAGLAHLDCDHFVIVHDDAEVFRAARFTQELVDPANGTYTFTNTDTGASYTSTAHYRAWIPDHRYEQYVPTAMTVVVRPVDPAEYAGTIGELHTIVRASLDTGNPIVWLL